MAIHTSYANTLDYTALFESVNQYQDVMNQYRPSFRPSSYDFYESIDGYGVNSADGVSEKALEFLTNAKEYAEKLKENLKDLTDDKETVFDKKTVSSDQTDKLTIKSTDGEKIKNMDEIKVQIDQIAKAQINTGEALNAKDKTALNAGYKTIEIKTADGKTTKISFKVSSTDTNEDVNKKIATAINEKGIGVTAKMTAEGGKSALQLTSAKTGVQSENGDNFTVRDVPDGGDTASKLRLNNVTQKAQDAKYSVNGEERTSQTNDVDLGNGITAALKGETEDKDVTVSLREDTLLALNEVRDLINNYNGLLDLAQSNENDKKSERLASELGGLSKTYRAALERIGVTKNANGYLEIDEDKMKLAAEDGSLRAFFKTNGYQSYGFTAGLKRTADNVTSNPSRYVTTAPTTSAGLGLSFSQASRLERLQSMGMLFNSYY